MLFLDVVAAMGLVVDVELAYRELCVRAGLDWLCFSDGAALFSLLLCAIIMFLFDHKGVLSNLN